MNSVYANSCFLWPSTVEPRSRDPPSPPGFNAFNEFNEQRVLTPIWRK